VQEEEVLERVQKLAANTISGLSKKMFKILRGHDRVRKNCGSLWPAMAKREPGEVS
jgi:uncharacterized coiled-coil DUF342 family protein